MSSPPRSLSRSPSPQRSSSPNRSPNTLQLINTPTGSVLVRVRSSLSPRVFSPYVNTINTHQANVNSQRSPSTLYFTSTPINTRQTARSYLFPVPPYNPSGILQPRTTIWIERPPTPQTSQVDSASALVLFSEPQQLYPDLSSVHSSEVTFGSPSSLDCAITFQSTISTPEFNPLEQAYTLSPQFSLTLISDFDGTLGQTVTITEFDKNEQNTLVDVSTADEQTEEEEGRRRRRRRNKRRSK